MSYLERQLPEAFFMKRRHFLSLSVSILGAMPLSTALCAQAGAQAVASATAPGNVPASQGVILYAQGHSLFLQSPDGATLREIKLALPETAKVEMVSVSDDRGRIAFRADRFSC